MSSTLPDNAAPSATQGVFRSALIGTGILVAIVAAGGALIGYLVQGMPGLWGALIGAGLVAFFCGVTSLTFFLTAKKSMDVIMRAMMLSWFVKTLIVFGVVMILKNQIDNGATAFSPEMLFATTAVGALATVILEWWVVSHARVPYFT